MVCLTLCQISLIFSVCPDSEPFNEYDEEIKCTGGSHLSLGKGTVIFLHVHKQNLNP